MPPSSLPVILQDAAISILLPDWLRMSTPVIKKLSKLAEVSGIRGVFLTVASAGGCCQTPVHPKMHLCGASNVWRFFLLLLLRECVGRCFMGLLSFPRLFVGVIMNRGGL